MQGRKTDRGLRREKDGREKAQKLSVVPFHACIPVHRTSVKQSSPKINYTLEVRKGKNGKKT